MEKTHNSDIVQIFLSKIFTMVGAGFVIAAIICFGAMNWATAGSFALYIVAIDFLGVGIPFLLVGISFGIYVSRKEKNRERLMAEGHRVLGKVIDYKPNYQVRLNRKNPVKLICETDEFAYDEKKRYISDNYWGNPETAINRDVMIYVDREKSNNYYIDMRRLGN